MSAANLHDRPPRVLRMSLRAIATAIRRPVERFLRIEAASGVVLLVAAVLALAWANSPWGEAYAALWLGRVGIRLGSLEFERSFAWVINDGLMVIFFFVVGLEIRREVHQGVLSSWRRAALPGVAALGGMVVPALIYLAWAGQPHTRDGWGVPMATDIAFAIGILTVMGSRVPPALRVLLLALAVIDDLGAIVVIAIFYSSPLAPTGILVAAVGFASIVAMQRLGVRSSMWYVAPGVLAWAGVYAAGIHPTVAGVIIGLMTPVHLPPASLGSNEAEPPASTEARPVERLIERLHPWVAFGIMPLFALANAGVVFDPSAIASAGSRVVVGVAAGLVLGKPLGVLLLSWIAVRLELAAMPPGITLRHLTILAVVAGVGFTMALFIAQLAFSDPGLLAAAKVGVLVASGVAAGLALLLGRVLLQPRRQHDADAVLSGP